MSDAARIVCIPAIITAAALFSWWWPGTMRRFSRHLAAASGVALLVIAATGCIHRQGPVAVMHRWLPHGLFIFAWGAIPLAIGVTLARFRGRPLATAALASELMASLGVLFLASVTGYLGPSHGASEASPATAAPISTPLR